MASLMLSRLIKQSVVTNLWWHSTTRLGEVHAVPSKRNWRISTKSGMKTEKRSKLLLSALIRTKAASTAQLKIFHGCSVSTAKIMRLSKLKFPVNITHCLVSLMQRQVMLLSKMHGVTLRKAHCKGGLINANELWINLQSPKCGNHTWSHD